jgi:hypothetical protein
MFFFFFPPGWGLRWELAWLLVPYFFFLTILKYRAAYHRKTKKRPCPNGDIESDNRLWANLKKFLLPEAKVSPVDEPLGFGLWSLLCYIVVTVLFPQPISLACFVIITMYPVVYELIVLCYGIRFIHIDYLAYNGRRYKCVQRDLLYARIQDGEQNSLHIPLMDLRGLIPPDTKHSGQ